ncbi:hypothetical protein X975_22548, partial [Stegodyphus mimosarum]
MPAIPLPPPPWWFPPASVPGIMTVVMRARVRAKTIRNRPAKHFILNIVVLMEERIRYFFV